MANVAALEFRLVLLSPPPVLLFQVRILPLVFGNFLQLPLLDVFLYLFNLVDVVLNAGNLEIAPLELTQVPVQAFGELLEIVLELFVRELVRLGFVEVLELIELLLLH